jgi:hypothetical protein
MISSLSHTERTHLNLLRLIPSMQRAERTRWVTNPILAISNIISSASFYEKYKTKCECWLHTTICLVNGCLDSGVRNEALSTSGIRTVYKKKLNERDDLEGRRILVNTGAPSKSSLTTWVTINFSRRALSASEIIWRELRPYIFVSVYGERERIEKETVVAL